MGRALWKMARAGFLTGGFLDGHRVAAVAAAPAGCVRRGQGI